MSKTWHRNKKREVELYVERSTSDGPDLSSIGNMPSWGERMRHCCRHASKPNKTLQREFTKFGISPISKSWKNILGERDEQSSRLHRLKRDMAHKRRHKMKVEAERIIQASI